MKFNETLLIGIALVAALVFSKGGAASSIFKKSAIPLLPLENQNQSKITSVIITPPQFTRIDVTDLLTNISSLELEKNIAAYQTEINKAKNYISSNQSNPYSPDPNFLKIAPLNWSGIRLLKKFESDGRSGSSLFPDFNLSYNRDNYNIIKNQAQFETAANILSENIEKTNAYVLRQQGEIDLINEEYQTRFGGLSRYG
jgi:hypothetical protein